jgi:transposase
MNFEELSDDLWSFMRPHLPPQLSVGRKRVDDRKTIDAILYVLITGCRWLDADGETHLEATDHMLRLGKS